MCNQPRWLKLVNAHKSGLEESGCVYLYKLCVRVGLQSTWGHVARLQDSDAAAGILPDLRDCLAALPQNGPHLQRSRGCLCERDSQGGAAEPSTPRS